MNNSRALYLRTKGNTIIIINYNLIISKVKFRILDTTLLPGCLVLFSPGAFLASKDCGGGQDSCPGPIITFNDAVARFHSPDLVRNRKITRRC
jgi:hypothetical protein